MGKIIDAQFGGRNAGDRYCVSCRERFPRRSALCPRCGGALTLWATHAVSAQERRDKSARLGWGALGLAVLAALLVAAAIYS